MERRMPATVLVAIVVALSGWVTTGIALYAQARRDNTTYERSQREAKSQRVRSAYRLALHGVNIILVAAVAASNPLATGPTLDERALQREREYDNVAEMATHARADLRLQK